MTKTATRTWEVLYMDRQGQTQRVRVKAPCSIIANSIVRKRFRKVTFIYSTNEVTER